MSHRLPRLLVGTTVLALTGGVLVVGAAPALADPPGAPGRHATWTEADKTGFGTARARGSNVWFTLQQGRTSEVFYPDLSTPSVRNLELVVVGRGFTDRESTDTRHRTSRPDALSLRFRQVNTDTRRDATRVRIRFTSLDGGRYRVYALLDPSLDNSGMDDRGGTAGHALVASDGTVASALVSRPRLGATSTGYLGTSDTFDKAMENFAVAYADQAERDHAALKAAVSAGKINVLIEEEA